MSPGPAVSVLVVEDEDSYVEALRIGLEREGFRVIAARDGVAGLEAFHAEVPDVVLLDVMLPEMSGLDVCREIRTSSTVPIIMVTARGEELDTVVGLEMGADDYVTKPFRLRELVARIRAVLRGRREADRTPAAGDEVSSIVVGDVLVDLDRHEATVRNEKVHLPLKEFELLATLLSHAGRVLTRDQLIERVWGFDYVGDTKTLDVHIKRLRSKLEPDPSNPKLIVTIRGLGYKYELPKADRA